MFSFYLKLEQRQTVFKSGKKAGTESTTPRYVAIAQAGYFQHLEALRGRFGNVVMYFKEVKDGADKSTAERNLQCTYKGVKGGVNFTSAFFHDIQHNKMMFASGEPNDNAKLKSGKPNPFCDCKNDGYLFIVTPDLKTIEILIIPNGRALIVGYRKKLADGQFDDELKQIRNAAKPM